jgi:hypothetical protein
MAYNFKNLAEVELLNEVPEGCTALAEVDGVVKRVPSKGLGGAGGIKTAIIKDSGYDNALAGLSTMASSEPLYTFECINMTFEEAYQTMASGEPLVCFGMFTGDGAMNMYGAAAFTGSAYFGVPCIVLAFELFDLALFWTADGLSTEMPSNGEQAD